MKMVALAMVMGVAAACGGGGGGAAVTGPSGATPTGGSNGGSTNQSGCGTSTICMLYTPSDAYTATGTGTGSFSPSSLTVNAGATVTFSNPSGVAHNVVFDGTAPVGGDIGVISSGSQTRTFTTAGTYPFHCAIHDGMSGTVTVK
jgi:plastocyanin